LTLSPANNSSGFGTNTTDLDKIEAQTFGWKEWMNDNPG